MRYPRPSVLTLTTLGVLFCASASAELIELDRCIAEKCRKNGMYSDVQITEEQFIVYIDANRCSGQGYYCPTRYAGFKTKDGTALDSGDYIPGTPFEGTIKVYVPREYKGMYVYGINGSDRDDYLSLVDFEDFRDARETTQPVSEAPGQSTIDDLIETIKRGYDERDATLLASAFADDATLSGGELGNRQLSGSAEIRSHFEARLAHVGGAAIQFAADERVVEGRLAYLRGSFAFATGPRSPGRFLWVLRFSPELGWRIQSAAQLPLL